VSYENIVGTDLSVLLIARIKFVPTWVHDKFIGIVDESFISPYNLIAY